MIFSIRKLVGQNDELVGKWVKISPEEREAIEDSLVGENYARGALNKSSLRLYFQNEYAVVCTHTIQAEAHPDF